MRFLEITTAIGCPVQCKYCPQDVLYQNYNGKRLFDFDDFSSCLAKIPHDVQILFQGMCEPWVNRECTKFIRYTHEQGRRIGLSTTLSCMTVDDINQIKDIDFHTFMIHLPSNDNDMRIDVNEQYLSILDLAIANIRNLQAVYFGELPSAIIPFAKRISHGHFWPLTDRSGSVDLADNSHIYIHGPLRECSRITGANILMPNGNVILCCSDYAQKHVLGNLLNQTYDEIYSSIELQRIRQGLTDEAVDLICRRCQEYGKF